MCCSRLAANTGRKKVAKNRHLGTIAQLRRAISSQLRHISTIGKKLVKQQYVLHMSPQYGELWPTSGWDRFTSLGYPCKFPLVLRLGSVTARHLVDNAFAATAHAPYYVTYAWGQIFPSLRLRQMELFAKTMSESVRRGVAVRFPVHGGGLVVAKHRSFSI